MSIKFWLEALEKVEGSGITTIPQLDIFIRCASNTGQTLAQITGFNESELADPEYKKTAHQVRKLMAGSPSRKWDGLHLLTWGDTVHGKSKAIFLTGKGKSLAMAMGIKF